MTTLERAVLAALKRSDAADPVDSAITIEPRALQLLLRRYQSGALDDGDANQTLGRALAVALGRYAEDSTVFGRRAWVELFVEAWSLSDDARLPEAIDALLSALRPAWQAAPLAQQCAALSASLYAATLDRFHAVAADAIDELERIIGRSYEPGERIGSAVDQVHAASALLAAYRLSGRLPYPMLAEELMQNVAIDAAIDLDAACEAARVLCRLATLHDDAGYRAAAIVAPGANYRRDAAQLLAARADEAVQRGADAAIYAVAQLELESGPPYGY